METKKIQISDDEIVVNVPVKKVSIVGIIVSVIIIASVVGLCGFWGDTYSHLFHSNFAIILGLGTGFFLSNKLIRHSKEQYMIAIDKKYIVIYNNDKQQVYKIADIRNWCINLNYRLTLWTHIRAFFTKSAGGCIAFNHASTEVPIRIGYGLTPSEAEELLEVTREKGWISDFQLSDTALEYKKNEKMKYAGGVFSGLIMIGLISTILLKEFRFIFKIMIVLIVLFSFIMAIVSYRQNKKRNGANNIYKNDDV